MTIARDAAKKAGRLADEHERRRRELQSTFKTVVVDGAKLSITYDTGDEGGEVNPRVSSMLPAL
jgi:hypothetical protein